MTCDLGGLGGLGDLGDLRMVTLVTLPIKLASQPPFFCFAYEKTPELAVLGCSGILICEFYLCGFAISKSAVFFFSDSPCT